MQHFILDCTLHLPADNLMKNIHWRRSQQQMVNPVIAIDAQNAKYQNAPPPLEPEVTTAPGIHLQLFIVQ